MFKLNKKLEYALMVVRHMAQQPKGQLVSAKDLSETYQIPFDTTSRVLQIMATQELLQATQGPHGGYNIRKNLEQVSFLDLSEMILGPIIVADCIHSSTACQLVQNCNITHLMLTFNQKVMDLCHRMSLAEMLDIQHNPLP